MNTWIFKTLFMYSWIEKRKYMQAIRKYAKIYIYIFYRVP